MDTWNILWKVIKLSEFFVCLLVYFLKVVIVKRLHLKDVKYQKSKKGHYSSQIIKYEFVNGAWERYKLTLNNSGNSDSFSITFHIITVSQFSRSGPTLWPHEPQHARPPCRLSPTPGVYSNSCPLSQWCHPTISSSVIPFSSCSQSLPASGSFQMSQFFASGGQSIGVSPSTSVLPMNTQGCSHLGWTGWISLQSKGVYDNSKSDNFKCKWNMQSHVKMYL